MPLPHLSRQEVRLGRFAAFCSALYGILGLLFAFSPAWTFRVAGLGARAELTPEVRFWQVLGVAMMAAISVACELVAHSPRERRVALLPVLAAQLASSAAALRYIPRMIGVVVASHGRLAEELLRTAEGVVGSLAQVRPVNVLASDPEVRHKIEEAIRAVDGGEGVLLLTDLLGGSPTQLCLSFLNERKVEVVTGVNLPMVLKLVSLRAAGKPIEQLAREVADAGQKAIGHASELLRGRMG